MSSEVNVALIGLDTSHTVQYAMRAHSPDCPADQRVDGLRTVACLRFETPFQGKDGLDERQKQLGKWGIPVTESLDEAVSDCDAIMLTINDPSRHLEYFEACADLGKPIFIDKPLAESVASARTIARIAKEKRVRVWSASSLRFSPQLAEASKAVPEPQHVSTYGHMGMAPVGSSIVWYGVHAFEMLNRAMGRGAQNVRTVGTESGAVCVVRYADGRQGVVELLTKGSHYAGFLRDKQKAAPFVVDSSRLYTDQLKLVAAFFHGGPAPVELEDAVEITAMLDAAERSLGSGTAESLGD
jgi:predicted dehydrogenase